MALADFLDDTVVLDMSSVTPHPLVLMLSAGLEQNADPRSSVDRYGAVSNVWDWGIESSNAIGDRAGSISCFLTTYVLPTEDQFFLVGHSLGPLPELVVRLVCDPESGDRAARLVAQHLPNLWSGLRGGAGLPDGHGLVKVRTDQDYWFFGGLLHSRSTTSVEVDEALVSQITYMAREILGEALGFPGNLPGILDVLPPDRRRQQLEDAASVFAGLANIVENLPKILS